MRVGIGFDAHPLVAGGRLVLGGVEISHTHGLEGHSDADVLVHSIIDALLGAAGLGDIGTHFPPQDPRFQDISSLILLERTAVLLAESGLRVAHIDATIVAESPRLSPFRDRMKSNVAEALQVDASRVNIKAKTAGGLGPLGQGDGMAAQAIAALEEA